MSLPFSFSVTFLLSLLFLSLSFPFPFSLLPAGPFLFRLCCLSSEVGFGTLSLGVVCPVFFAHLCLIHTHTAVVGHLHPLCTRLDHNES